MPKFTLVIYRAPEAYTNQWNDFTGVDWTQMMRGNFSTPEEACDRARDILPHGAPFSVLEVS